MCTAGIIALILVAIDAVLVCPKGKRTFLLGENKFSTYS